MVSGQFGDISIFIALVMAALSGGAFFITALGGKNLHKFGRQAFYTSVVFVTIAVVYLWYLFFSHDFSIKYVYEYSSLDLPFFYLLSSLWAGQDGTYLLWLFFSSIFGLIIIRYAKQYTSWAMVFYFIVNLFLFIMLLTISPFRKLDGVPPDGAGLNPLLQDPWMVIHPPVIFLAFAMAGVVFAIILSAMIRKDYSNWLKIGFPYIAITSLALALANVLGGYWAYKTLGWGGYWAWDPVENTSFIPWVVSLGLIHGLIIEKKTGALRRSNLLLGISLFLLSIYGTFLTRSGVLADFSVHSFVDLGANAVLIAFVLLYIVLTLGIYLFSSHPNRIGKTLNYDIFSRDFFLLVGMILLSVLGLIVLFWSSLPFITTYLSSTPRAAEPSTYNTFAFPFAIIFSLFLTLWPFVKENVPNPNKLGLKAMVIGIISLIITFALSFWKVMVIADAIAFMVYLSMTLIYLLSCPKRSRIVISLIIGAFGLLVSWIVGARGFEYLFFIFAATSAIGAQAIAMKQYIPGNLKSASAHISHFGFGLMLVGILASSVFDTNKQVILPRGEAAAAFDYEFTYQGMSGTMMNKDNELLVNMESNGTNIDARPQFFYNKRLDGVMKRPHIKKNLTYDIYLSPQDIQEMPQAHGLVLGKNESDIIGEYDIKFLAFELDSHGESASMKVGVKLEVTKDDVTESIMPTFISSADGVINEPTPLFSDQLYDVMVEKIDASSGTVSLSIPGLIEAGSPDQLILDVSIKPGINLLWLGTIFVFIGNFLTIRSRFKK